MPEEGAGATRSRHAYVFKISSPGVRTFLRSNLELPSEIAPGRTVPATLRVTNTGSVRSESASAVLSAPQGLSTEPSTVAVRSLKPGETMTIPVSVSVARDTPQGQHDLTLRFTQGRISTATPVPVTVKLENLALGKPATQKSTGWDAPASRAVDNNTDGSFWAGSVTHTAEPEHEAWWQVDLGRSASLDSVEIWNRTDCCADRLTDFWVLTSDQPITADDLNEARTAPGVTAVHITQQAGRPTVVDLPAGTTGRYVRVQLASPTNPLSLAELQVRGA